MALIMTNTACAQEFEKDTFKAPSGKEIEIYAIKHGSMRIVFDHLDKKAIAHLTKASTRIITNLNCEKILGKSAYHYGETHINKVEELLIGSGIEVRIRNYQ